MYRELVLAVRPQIRSAGCEFINTAIEYSEKDISRLKFVLSARQLGFTVDDIQEILAQADKKESPCPTVRRLIDQRLHDTEQRFLEMVRLRERMVSAVDEWGGKPDRAPTGHMICHLIEDFIAES